jgi:hypothetical protein
LDIAGKTVFLPDLKRTAELGLDKLMVILVFPDVNGGEVGDDAYLILAGMRLRGKTTVVPYHQVGRAFQEGCPVGQYLAERRIGAAVGTGTVLFAWLEFLETWVQDEVALCKSADGKEKEKRKKWFHD